MLTSHRSLAAAILTETQGDTRPTTSWLKLFERVTGSCFGVFWLHKRVDPCALKVFANVSRAVGDPAFKGNMSQGVSLRAPLAGHGHSVKRQGLARLSPGCMTLPRRNTVLARVRTTLRSRIRAKSAKKSGAGGYRWSEWWTHSETV